LQARPRALGLSDGTKKQLFATQQTQRTARSLTFLLRARTESYRAQRTMRERAKRFVTQSVGAFCFQFTAYLFWNVRVNETQPVNSLVKTKHHTFSAKGLNIF